MKFRLKRKIVKFFFKEQWSLLVCKPSGEILTRMVPPPGRIWADPFPVETGGKTYVFIEQQIGYGRGTLGYIELYPDLSYSEFTPILEKEYHLSFPYIFSLGNGFPRPGRDRAPGDQKTWYMIPESHENRTIDLYRALEFPGKWIYETTLMDNIAAVDSAVFFHNGKWWLFTGLGSEKGSLNSNLSAFYADTFPSRAWTPHPRNPLCSDPEKSRMAGAVYPDQRGRLMRPAQSCVKEYGEKILINEISELSAETYREKTVKTISPEKKFRAVCTHTVNYSEHYLLRDIKTRTFRFSPPRPKQA
jgi:hypothetical protein